MPPALHTWKTHIVPHGWKHGLKSLPGALARSSSVLWHGCLLCHMHVIGPLAYHPSLSPPPCVYCRAHHSHYRKLPIPSEESLLFPSRATQTLVWEKLSVREGTDTRYLHLHPGEDMGSVVRESGLQYG